MGKLGIYIPTYKRPQILQKVADNIKENTYSDYNLVWGLEPDDKAGIKAAKATGYPVIINTRDKGYSNTIQTIYEATDDEFFFDANDDFIFTKDWDKAPMLYFKDYPDVHVIGVDDGTEANTFSTIFFIRRTYIEEQSGVVDMPNQVLYPYKHNYSDTEFTQTAKNRGVWARVGGKCIVHERLPLDETYQMNNATFGEDSDTYNSRVRLFS